MKLPLLGILAAYVIVAVLLLSLNLASRWHWAVKAAAIAVTSGFFGVSYFSIGALLGWPSEAPMPEHFRLHWATIVEPDKVSGSLGSIFLWTEQLDADNLPAGIPRAFRVPYSRELADRIARVKQRIEQGIAQVGTARDPAVPEGEPAEDQRRAETAPRRVEPGSPGDPSAFIRNFPSIDFADLPPPALPPKPPL